MQLTEVNNKKLANEFLLVNVEINRNNPAYIRPLDKDINTVFDPEKNKSFRFGKATRWVLKDESTAGSEGKLIGRIAAFTNSRYKNKGDDIPVGCIGFFDCINDQNAADILFDVAKHWLMQQGMQAMDGPVNFGERDRWWGLVVKGNEIPPMYGMNFNPPYYQKLFENYGFKKFYNQICFALKVNGRLQEKFFERHAMCARDPNFSSTHLKKNQLEKFVKDFTIVYNRAWAGHGGMKQIEEKVAFKLFKAMKPVLDERINWFVYYKGEPVGVWINLTDLNQWFKYLNGKFDFWHKLKFLWIKSTIKNKKFTGLIFGVVPEFQGKGVDSYLIVEGAKVVQGLHIENGEYKNGIPIYEDYEMQWVGEFNPKMINIAESLGTYRSRILTTYRYLFDRTKEFKPHPVLD
ncbi:MAG: hypothetical protein IT214_09015 [Chitinophagaceae bacterium]|jgi:GNAT superfamily N-acetyltransferase|nr:hypothetical protein [Chitinophagaceae bacterium]OQY94749.1 MAG: hypothetical protein B6D37_07800 [Sphingobacteriales bacterium UTBCD1]